MDLLFVGVYWKWEWERGNASAMMRTGGVSNTLYER